MAKQGQTGPQEAAEGLVKHTARPLAHKLNIACMLAPTMHHQTCVIMPNDVC